MNMINIFKLDTILYSNFTFIYSTIFGDFKNWIYDKFLSSNSKYVQSVSDEFCYGIPLSILFVLVFIFIVWRFMK